MDRVCCTGFVLGRRYRPCLWSNFMCEFQSLAGISTTASSFYRFSSLPVQTSTTWSLPYVRTQHSHTGAAVPLDLSLHWCRSPILLVFRSQTGSSGLLRVSFPRTVISIVSAMQDPYIHAPIILRVSCTSDTKKNRYPDNICLEVYTQTSVI